MREDRVQRDVEARDLRRQSDELRAEHNREISETHLFNRELLIRMEKTYANMGSTMGLVGDELVAVRQDLHELKAAVDAQTKAILKLVDRFEDTDGRPPV